MPDKMIPESDLIKFKKGAEGREERLKTENEGLRTKVTTLTTEASTAKAQLKTVKSNLEDDGEVSELRDYLLKEDEKNQANSSKNEQDRTSLDKREREVRVKEIVAEYKSKGVELDSDEIVKADDMDNFAVAAFNDHLAKENEALRKGETPENPNSPESVLDINTGTPISKKKVADMSNEEFDKSWASMNAEALAKK